MRLAGRLTAAIEVLDDMEKRHRPVADALKDWGLAHRFAGSGDRAAIGTIVYDALRRRASLSWRMDADTPVASAYGALFEMLEQFLKSVKRFSDKNCGKNKGLEQLGEPSETKTALECDSEIVHFALTSQKDVASLVTEMAADSFAPPPLDVSCLQAWQSRDLRNAPDEIGADIPAWSIDFFKNLYGESWMVEARALSERPPLDLRRNLLKASHEKLTKVLSEYKPRVPLWFIEAWRIAPTTGFQRHPNVQAIPAFQKGWFEIQDLGSQIVAYLAAAQSNNGQVLDYCAGGGGKTLALAAHMENHGQIYAYDADKTRLTPIFARLQRAGVRNVQVIDNGSGLTKLERKMDLVLVDAPCSGSGTWRRHPDAKWRLRPSQLGRRVEEQRTILEKASHFVRPGGQLAYITCSLFDVENSLQIHDFLRQNPDFQAIDLREQWQLLMPPDAPRPHFDDLGLYLSPASTMSDGFYITIVERR